MERIEISLSEVHEQIRKFYAPNEWHLSMVNGVDLGDQYEIHWVFSHYSEKNRVVLFAAQAGYEEPIPTITNIIPSAWVSEAEVHDLLGAKIENAKPGLFLEKDMQKAPLKKEPIQ